MTIVTDLTALSLAEKGFESAQNKIANRRGYIFVGFIGGTLSLTVVALEVFVLHNITHSLIGLGAKASGSNVVHLFQGLAIFNAICGVSGYLLGINHAVKLKRDYSKKLIPSEIATFINEETTLLTNSEKYVEKRNQQKGIKMEGSREEKDIQGAKKRIDDMKSFLNTTYSYKI